MDRHGISRALTEYNLELRKKLIERGEDFADRFIQR